MDRLEPASHSFECSDPQSLEARLLKHKARVQVQRRCRALGIAIGKVKFAWNQVSGQPRLRGADVRFRCEAYAVPAAGIPKPPVSSNPDRDPSS
jgi:hypothetical protein